MSKEVLGYVKLTIPAGKATPSPPVGPALGQRGVNIMEFCKAFNGAKHSFEPGTPLPVEITVYKNKTFSFIIKTPPASYFLKKYANIEKGSSAAKRDAYVGKVTRSQCKEIAKLKMSDLNAYDFDAATKIICGSAESMGLQVIED